MSELKIWLGTGSFVRGGGERLFNPRLILLAIERFDIDPFSLELSDNNELFTESLSSAGISNFGISLIVLRGTNTLPEFLF